jgi:hypothetical protein
MLFADNNLITEHGAWELYQKKSLKILSVVDNNIAKSHCG